MVRIPQRKVTKYNTYNNSFFLYHSFLTIQHKISSQRLAVLSKELVFQSERKKGDCLEVYGFHQNKNLQRRIFSHWICSRSSKAIGIVKHYYMERNRINRKALTFTTIFLCGTVFLIKNHSLLGNPPFSPTVDLDSQKKEKIPYPRCGFGACLRCERAF